MRLPWLLGVTLLLSCGFDSHTPADAGTDAPPLLPCVDADGDGYGEGDGCRGPDCREGDPTVHECACDPDAIVADCACAGSDEPMVCYDGPPGTGGLGNCRPGLRRCVDGRWSECIGQMLPDFETCDLEDEDCDGVVDNGVQSACGDCDPGCTVVRWGVDGDPFPLEGEPAPRVRDDGSITIGDGQDRAVTTIQLPNWDEWCPPLWGPLDASADVPARASVFFEMRVGANLTDLEAQEWSPVLHMPFADPPADLVYDRWRTAAVQIRVTLIAREDEALPVLHWMSVQRRFRSCTD